MVKRNRQTFKKREREMAKKQKKQDKAERIADRKANRTSEDDPEEVNPAPVDDADKPSGLRTVPIGRSDPPLARDDASRAPIEVKRAWNSRS